MLEDAPKTDAALMRRPPPVQGPAAQPDEAAMEEGSDNPEGLPAEMFHDAQPEFELDESEEVDWENDPLVSGPEQHQPPKWSHEYFEQFVPRKATAPEPEASLRQQMRDLLAEIEAGPPDFTRGEEGEALTDWLQKIHEKVHPVEEFVAGSFWQASVWPPGRSCSASRQDQPPRRPCRGSRVRHDIKPSFHGTAECDAKKLDRVRRMHKRVVAEARAEEWLSVQVPHPVKFPNHRSFVDNSDFGVEADSELLVNSTVKLYGKDERRPKVVNPLGVANLPKGRLVLDGGYINAFIKHIPFKYETLREILTFLRANGFFSTWDFKAGYYHLLIHPRFRTYFGFRIGQSYFHYNAMCFGWSEACYAYTVVTQEAAKELRVRGIPVSSYLDDGFTGVESYLACLSTIIMIVRYLTLLGAVFSLAKCQFWPIQNGGWLGFVVDTVAQQFRVSDGKMEKVRATLNELLGAQKVTPRLLAKVAGRIIAMSPAVLPASLFSRPLLQAIQGKLSSEDAQPNSCQNPLGSS
jgi:hypothetical protein